MKTDRGPRVLAFASLVTIATAAVLVPAFAAGAGFDPATSIALSPHPRDVVASDFDGDGDSDLALASSTLDTVSIFPSNGDGTFATPTTYAGPGFTYALETSDFNSDGIADLVASGLDGAVRAFLGSGDGTFVRQPDALVEVPYNIATADFNGDGDLDVLTASILGKIQFLAGRGDGSFDAALDKHIGLQIDAVAAGDVDGDAVPDAVLGFGFHEKWATLHGNGDGTFADPLFRPVPSPGRPAAAEVVDFNRDGRGDVVIGNYLSGTVAVALANPDGTLAPASEYATGGVGGLRLAVADIDVDGELDVVTVAPNILSILFGRGDGTLGDLTVVDLPAQPFQVAVGDFDRNGAPDLAASSPFPGSLLILLQRAVDTEPPQIAVPNALSVDATSPGGASVAYAVTATDNVAVASLLCVPASGTVFAIGTTTVNCTATDASGNAANASFDVHVKSADEQLVDLIDRVTGLGPGSSLIDKLTAVQAALGEGDHAEACRALAEFANEVRAQSGKKLTPAQATELIQAAARIRAVLDC